MKSSLARIANALHPAILACAELKRIRRDMPGRSRERDFFIEAMAALASAGHCLNRSDPDSEECYTELLEQYDLLSEDVARAIKTGKLDHTLLELRKRYKFNLLEMKILLITIASSIGIGPDANDVEAMQELFPAHHHGAMEVARAFLPDARLAASNLVTISVSDRFKDTAVSATNDLIDPILRQRGDFVCRWQCESQEELFGKLYMVHRLLRACAAEVEKHDDNGKDFSERRELLRVLRLFEASVKPEWPVHHLFDGFKQSETIVLMALLCQAVVGDRARKRFYDEFVGLYTGEGLSRVGAGTMPEVRKVLRATLMPSARLVADGWIQPVLAGVGEMLEEDEDTVRNLTFELTDACLEKIGVKRRRSTDRPGRTPLVTMDQLVLPPEVRDAVELAASQYRNRDVLAKWEIEKSIAYGRAVTMLFSGPPGVGKTATAEAVAHLLGKNILVADYSELQSCWVGATEKNIVSLFRQAREGDCVLFWDEADAMFYDRDSARQNWEVRDVNVLLQELEKFDGVCILSTNRKVALDKALARRISLKVEFALPERSMQRTLWEKILPAKMPLHRDVDLDRLSEIPMTGGEIKNVVLNAARRAASRGTRAKVRMDDLLRALKAEEAGKDTSGHNGRKIGFR